MNTEQRLRAALDARAATATPAPGAFGEIRRRGRKRLWTTRLQVAGAAAAVTAVTIGAAAVARDGDRRAVAPPVASESAEPSPTASPTQSASPTTSPTTAPASGPAVGPDEFVALLEDGRLVVASATTGNVTRTVLADAVEPRRDGLRASADVTLAPDRRSIYLATDTTSGCGRLLERVDVGTGRRTTIGRGSRPDVSPDGTMLVYVDECPEAAVVRDLRTGAERRYDHHQTEATPEGYSAPWRLERVVWHSDGRRLWVVVDWENMTELRLLDPATDRTTNQAEAIRTQHTNYYLDRHGAGLVYVDDCCYAEGEGPDRVVVRAADGTERRVVHAPDGLLGAVTAGPGGDLLYERAGRLYRYRAATGTSSDLGTVTALGRDW